MLVSQLPNFILIGFLFLTPKAQATEVTCMAGYSAFSHIEVLVDFESKMQAALVSFDEALKRSGLSPNERNRLAIERHARFASLKFQYDTLSDSVLAADGAEVASFKDHLADLETQLESVGKFPTLAQKATHSFSDIVDQPSLMKANVSYDVPQAASISGAANPNKLTISISSEVADYFSGNAHRAAQFLRAVQKGYVPTASGTGMVRITDQHEHLVEIKVVGGVKTRLLACRRAEGVLEIMKVHEKQNEGGGGSLKRFANLCD